MDKELLKKRLAPCSICCDNCTGYCYGVTSEKAQALKETLVGHDEFLKNVVKSRKIIKQYYAFDKKLDEFVNAPCKGCREDTRRMSCVPNCKINDCVIEHGVDFCGECSAFPCKKISEEFKGELLKAWSNGSERIKEIGAEAYYDEITRRK